MRMDNDRFHTSKLGGYSDRSALPVEVRMDNIIRATTKNEAIQVYNISSKANRTKGRKIVKCTTKLPDLSVICAGIRRMNQKEKCKLVSVDMAEDIHEHRFCSATVHHTNRMKYSHTFYTAFHFRKKHSKKANG